MIDNGYGVQVKPVCDQCGEAIRTLNGKLNDYTPYPCDKCGKTLCGNCAIEGYDGEHGTFCKACRISMGGAHD